MDFGLENKVAVVAAASKGLGKAVALELAREGAKIAICARNRDELRATAELIRRATGAEVYDQPADVSSIEDVRSLIANVVARFGGIHVLVTNAGGPPSAQFDKLTPQDWLAAFNLNLMSVVQLCAEAIPHMRRAQWGRIINITSIAVKQPVDGLMLSNSLRAAVAGFAKTLANEVALDNILVNNVCPGYTRTERLEALSTAIAERAGVPKENAFSQWESQIPLRRLGRPEEFAALVAFLASERASYITGTTIAVDGGYVQGLL